MLKWTCTLFSAFAWFYIKNNLVAFNNKIRKCISLLWPNPTNQSPVSCLVCFSTIFFNLTDRHRLNRAISRKTLGQSWIICPNQWIFSLHCGYCRSGFKHPGWGLLSKIHVRFHVVLQWFYNMASDWLSAVLPVNQVWKSLLTKMNFFHANFLVTQAPGRQ